MGKIIAKKYTDISLARAAIERTSRNVKVSEANLRQIYLWEHSPIRTQMFWIDMIDIPTFVSVHNVRHHIWMQHFVLSNRPDRGGPDDAGRYTPIDHSLWCNAQSLINMMRQRLCYKPSPETREVALEVKEAIRLVDPDLAHFLVPNCVYRGGLCTEPKACGHYRVCQYQGEIDEQRMRC